MRRGLMRFFTYCKDMIISLITRHCLQNWYGSQQNGLEIARRTPRKSSGVSVVVIVYISVCCWRCYSAGSAEGVSAETIAVVSSSLPSV